MVKLISENKLKRIIKEELSIAKEVSDISSSLYLTVVSYIKSEKVSPTEVSPVDRTIKFVSNYGINVILNMTFFKNYYDFQYGNATASNPDFRQTGYSKIGNTLQLYVSIINGVIPYDEISDSIQHEIEHWYQQSRNNGSLFGRKYERITQMANSNDVFISTLSRIYYFTRKFEIDSYLNGAYATALRNGCYAYGYDGFIKNTNIGVFLSTLKSFINKIEEWDWSSQYVINAVEKVYGNNCPDKDAFKKKLISMLEKSYNYLLRKSAKVYSKAVIDGKNKTHDGEKYMTESELRFERFAQSDALGLSENIKKKDKPR